MCQIWLKHWAPIWKTSSNYSPIWAKWLKTEWNCNSTIHSLESMKVRKISHFGQCVTECSGSAASGAPLCVVADESESLSKGRRKERSFGRRRSFSLYHATSVLPKDSCRTDRIEFSSVLTIWDPNLSQAPNKTKPLNLVESLSRGQPLSNCPKIAQTLTEF